MFSIFGFEIISNSKILFDDRHIAVSEQGNPNFFINKSPNSCTYITFNYLLNKIPLQNKSQKIHLQVDTTS